MDIEGFKPHPGTGVKHWSFIAGGTKAEARTAEYYRKRPCPELCRMCADLCAEFIAAHPEGRCGVYKEDV